MSEPTPPPSSAVPGAVPGPGPGPGPGSSQGGAPPGPPGPPRAPVKTVPATMVTYKRLLRKEIRRRFTEHEAQFLNITAMLDMMTIILVFLLKSMAASTASIPQSKDLKMPDSTLTTEATEEGLAVMVSKTEIIVDDNKVCPVPADATHGLEGKYKRSGPNDTYIVPLANAVQSWREKDKAFRRATGKDPTFSEAKIIADEGTPYRLITEVLQTLGASEFNKFHLMVLQGAKK